MQIGSLIRRSAQHFKDAPCLTEGGRTVSFIEFDQATDRLGNSLLDAGLKPGDRVGVALPNSIQCLVAYYSLAKAGLVRVALNTRETVLDHNYKLQESGARGVIHDSIDGLDAEFRFALDAIDNMMSNGNDKPCIVDRPMDSVFRLAFTGGTTGRPKAVTLTTRGELVEFQLLLTELMGDISENDVFLHGAPVAHASGALFLPALARGAHSIVMKKFDITEFLQLAESTKATLTLLVPTMLAMIMEEPGLSSFDLKFRRIAYGASSISPSVLQRAEKHFGRIFTQFYGQAESPMAISCLKPEDHDRTGSCGRPFSVVDVAIFDDNDEPLPSGEIGEIVCRGPQLMAGYWNRPNETADVFRRGWLHTGDIGKMDEDGFVYIMDRKNDMLVSGGFNVYPREVEDVLMAFGGVIEAAVVGLPDEKWGDRIHAVVAGNSSLDTDELMKFARDKLANFKCPKSIDIWPELPKSAANKILRREVREKVLAGLNADE